MLCIHWAWLLAGACVSAAFVMGLLFILIVQFSKPFQR